ncbi:uncharacterized protein TNCV_4608911 [Trichonephila clavipes]|nr:uncharacterized protein TNCV_4608911 [Trichonephila clavipes]
MRDSGFVTATLTGKRYADMLQNRIIPSLADKHLLERTDFMQHGAPPHIARRVKDLLRRSYGDDRVLSRHFHHSWPPRSPGLSPDEAHFWLNGYVNKQNCRIWSEANPQVYVETPLNPEKLTVWCALWAGGILL